MYVVVTVYIEDNKFNANEANNYIKFLNESGMLLYDGRGASIGDDNNIEEYFYNTKSDTNFNYLLSYEIPSYINIEFSGIFKRKRSKKYIK